MTLPSNSRYRNPNGATQPTLLTSEELTELWCPVAPRSPEGETKVRQVGGRDFEERIANRDGATQIKFPGF